MDVTAIRAGRLVDVDAGEVLTDRVILVRDGRIESIEPDPGRSTDGARVVDLTGFTVTPGLIDCHTHLIGAVEAGAYPMLLARTAAQEAMAGVRNARDTLLAGFTTVRDVGTFRAFVDIALRDAINDGTVIGPRMACAGAYVTAPGGGGEITGLAHDIELPRDLRYGVANSPAEVRLRVRDILSRGADLIKVIATGAVLAPGTEPGVPEFTEDEIRAAVEEAALQGKFVAAHAHGPEGIKNAIRAGVRSIEHGSLLDDGGIALMLEHGTYLVADIYCGDYIAEEGGRSGWEPSSLRKNAETTDAQRAAFGKAVEAGVKMAYGTDSGVYPHAWAARQLPYMVRHGMAPMQALQSASVVAAELIGWEEQVGSIAPGKRADLIAVEGDGLADDLERFGDVSFVMKGGEILKG